LPFSFTAAAINAGTVRAAAKRTVLISWLEGYAVFSIKYRLAPKYPYPDMVYDVERSIRYIRHHAKRWAADGKEIVLSAALRALNSMGGLLNLPGDLGARDSVNRESATVQAVVTLYAQSSFATVPLNKDVHALLDPLIQQKGEQQALREAAPITHLTKTAPHFS
jgi:hypothetical protein